MKKMWKFPFLNAGETWSPFVKTVHVPNLEAVKIQIFQLLTPVIMVYIASRI